MSIEIVIGVWVATGLSLFMYSFLYKDNPFFKLGEHIYVGVSVGYGLVITYYEVMVKKLYIPMVQGGNWWLILPTFLGLLVLARFIPALAWLSRLSFAFIVGVGSGIAIPRVISSLILQQVQGTLKPLVTTGDGGVVWFTFAGLNTLLIVVGVVSVLFYCFFSIEHTGVVHKVTRIGIYFLMVSFGAAFGYTVMARMSLLIGRFDELIQYASPDYDYATLVLLVVVIAGLVLWERSRTPESGNG